MNLNSFNKIAPGYDRLAQFIFGNSIRDGQTRYLEDIPPGSKILVLGGGTGWWLKALQRHNPTCKIWFIDASSEMVERAGRNSSRTVVLIHGTEENIPPVEFDAVITFFFLDLFKDDDMKKVIEKISLHLSPDCIWLISDFVNDKYWHRPFLFVMYLFFRVIGAIRTTALGDWRKNMCEHHFRCTDETYFFGKFINAGVYQKRLDSEEQ